MKVVLFDLDGTIIDSETKYYLMWKRIMKNVGYELDLDIYKTVVGSPTSVIQITFENYFGKIKNFDKLYNRFMEERNSALENGEFPLVPGIKEYLLELQYREIVCGVVTSSYQKEAITTLENLEIDHFFSFGVYGDDVVKGKPSPDIYLQAIQKASKSIDKIIAFEDSYNGIKSAVTAGLKCYHIKNFIPDMSSISEFVEESFTDFFEVINKKVF